MNIQSILERVPELAVVVFLVITFLKVQKEMAIKFTETLDKAETRREKVLETIGDDCHAVQRDSIQVMGEVRDALGANTEVLRQVHTAMITEDRKAS